MPLIPDIDEFEERAAIMEYDGGFSRSMAEDRAAQEQVSGTRPSSGRLLPITCTPASGRLE